LKLLIDENLPPESVAIFREVGFHGVFHVNQIKKHYRQSIKDAVLRKYALYKGYVILSRDDDFVSSWVSRKVPEKLVYVYFDGKKEGLIHLFKIYASTLLVLLETESLIEISKKGIRVPFA
jgi:predicted nuclease of predicted toxin-antitoxin system